MRPVEVSEFWRERLQLYGTAILFAYVTFLTTAAVLRYWPVGPDGFAVASDFASFWSAGRLALKGQAAEAYDWAVQKATQVAEIGRDFEGNYPWHNPPHAFFLVLPFGVPSYLLGWLLWGVAGVAFLAGMLRLAVPGFLVPMLLAAPATLWCAVAGQNGFLTAGLMAGCLALVERRPWMAGAFLGVMTYKPQFGLLFPLVLLLERRWTVIASATLTAILLVAASALAFGTATWLAFFDSISTTNGVLLRGGAGWTKLQSLYAIAFQLTDSITAALAVQFLVLAVCAAAIIWLCLRPGTTALRAAALVAASCLATPYVYIYDAVMLTTAAAFLLRDGLDRGFGRFERPLIMLGCALPVAFFLIGSVATPIGALTMLGTAAMRSVRIERQERGLT
jgi:hypothetical protein